MSFDTGLFPHSVAIADLNADGRPDLVVVNLNSHTVSVLRANGDGSFAPKADYLAGSYPMAVAVADLNADGRPDLAVTNGGSYPNDTGTVSVLLGRGDGTFGEKTDFGSMFSPNSVAISDLNADGRPDLVVTNSGIDYAGAVSVMLGNGDGTFGAKTDFDGGRYPGSVAIADLNADGRPDLVVANSGQYPNYDSKVSVLLGNGDGTFGARSGFGAGLNPSSVAIVDLNADGRPDLAVANSGSNPNYTGTVSVLLGSGDGTFGLKTDFDTGLSPACVVSGDLNADGRPDLVLASYNSHSASVLLGNGDGTLAPNADVHSGDYPTSVAIADLDADGRPDLAVASSYSNSVSVLHGNGDGTFGTDIHFGTGGDPYSVAVADLDGDGRSDLAVANATSNTVSVLLGHVDGTFGPRTDFGTGLSPRSVAIADLNGDGWRDLAVANASSNTVSVLLGSGSGTFGARTDFGAGSFPFSVAIADLNGDGRPDLVVANVLSNSVSVLLGIGDGTFGPKVDFGAGRFPSSVAIGDLNGDGRPDLAVGSGSSSSVSVFMGNGDGTFGAKADFSTGGGPISVAIADLNADGRPDLASANFSPSTVSVLLGNGDGTFGAKSDFMTGSVPFGLGIADLDADGRPDLATANGGGNTVSVLLGNGDGTFRAKTDFGTGRHPRSLAIADLNADGRLDLAVTNEDSSTVSVHLNRGTAPVVAMAFDLTPGSLNLASRGLWLTGYLEPPLSFSAADVDIASIRLMGTVSVDPAAPSALGDQNGNGIPDLMVKFNRLAVELALPEGDQVPVMVSGTVGGQAFLGTDHIRVRRVEVSAPAAGSHVTAGSVAQVLWQTPSSVTVHSVTLLHSVDGGGTWSLIARGRPDIGSYDWTVPDVQTAQAKVAVVLVDSADATGDQVDGVVGMSETFSIESLVGVDGRTAVPRTLSIRCATPNHAPGGRLGVAFALPDGSPARLELTDVAGRLLTSKEVGTLGRGTHTLDLSGSVALRSGIYFLRLTQGGKVVRARVAVLRQ